MVISVPSAQPDLQTRTATLADGRVMVSRRVHATVDQVWAVLADGRRYATWVVGATRVGPVDREWPMVGSRVRHRAGPWPVAVDGHAVVLACEPGRQLLLRTHAWPAGGTRLRIMVTASGSHGSIVRIAEDGADGVTGLMPRRIRDPLVGSGHRETLRRLALIAEGRHALEHRRSIRSGQRIPEPVRRWIS